jgi:hypothetical protein
MSRTEEGSVGWVEEEEGSAGAVDSIWDSKTLVCGGGFDDTSGEFFWAPAL